MSTDLTQLAKELIARPSITPKDADCQQMIAERLKHCGFETQWLNQEQVTNSVMTLGSKNAPTFAFLGHTDVVPTGDLNAWRFDPFSAMVEDDMLHGRGAADMKGSLAAMVIALERLAAKALPVRLMLLLTSDEEGDAQHGIRHVARVFKIRGERLDWCLVGEPSSNKRLGDVVRIGRRGSLTAHITVHGTQGHVAYPEKARNAVHDALEPLNILSTMKWDDGHAAFPPSSLQIADVQAGVGASNVIPGTCKVLLNIRYNPNWTAEALRERIEAVFVKHHVDADIRWHHSGKPFYTEQMTLRNAVRHAVNRHTNFSPEENTAGGTSDGRFIAPLGVEVVELGPRNETIHQVNECVSIKDLHILADIYHDTVMHIVRQMVG